MKIKIECPQSFLDFREYTSALSEMNLKLSETDPEILIVNPGTRCKIDEEYLSKFKNLKIIGTPSTGVNHIDLDYCDLKGIKVFSLLDNRPALESITASAEFTWLHIMNAFRKFNRAIDPSKRFAWRGLGNENRLRSNELSGKKIGIIGMGRIGRNIKRYAEAFRMNVKYFDPYSADLTLSGIPLASVQSLEDLRDVDVLSINCYLNDETEGMITDGFLESFDKFGKGLIVVNTSRGEVVDEEYISKHVLHNNIFYATDVICNEQNQVRLAESPLLRIQADNLVISPHVAGATIESQSKAFYGILQTCTESL